MSYFAKWPATGVAAVFAVLSVALLVNLGSAMSNGCLLPCLIVMVIFGIVGGMKHYRDYQLAAASQSAPVLPDAASEQMTELGQRSANSQRLFVPPAPQRD